MSRTVSTSRAYCGPIGQSPLAIAGAPLRAGIAPMWAQLKGARVEFTYGGRGAAKLLLDSWNIGKGDEVLAPSYNCGTELDAIYATGAEAVLYRVDRSAKIDVRDLAERITPRTRAVYVTHFFGWPQDLGEIGDLCKRHNLKLIEDCALSLFSADGSTPLGLAGDGAAYSLTKSLGVPDGGVAVWNRASDKHALASPLHAPSPLLTLRRCMSLVKRDFIRRLTTCGIRRHGAADVSASPDAHVTHDAHRASMPEHYYFRTFDEQTAASRCTRGVIAHIEPHEIISARRTNYNLLAESLASIDGVRPLFASLPEGVCPLAMPVIVDDRARWVRSFGKAGVDAIGWWAGYYRTPAWDTFPEACYLKDHVMTLPIHQLITASSLQHIATCARAISTSSVPAASSAMQGGLC